MEAGCASGDPILTQLPLRFVVSDVLLSGCGSAQKRATSPGFALHWVCFRGYRPTSRKSRRHRPTSPSSALRFARLLRTIWSSLRRIQARGVERNELRASPPFWLIFESPYGLRDGVSELQKSSPCLSAS